MSEYSNQDYAGLFMKMKNVMASIGAIEKTGRNTTQNYNYMESDVIVTAIRGAMIENNLAFMVGMPSCELSEIVTKNKDGAERITTRAMVRMDMMLLDCDTGCVMSVPFSNEALDTSDKAVNKAVTAAKKYWLIATFMVSTKDDDSDKDTLPKSRANTTPRADNRHQGRTPASAPETPQTGTQGENPAILKTSPVGEMTIKRKDANSKPYAVIAGVTFFSGELLRAAGFDMTSSEWKTPGKYPFPDGVKVVVGYHMDGDYKVPDSVEIVD